MNYPTEKYQWKTIGGKCAQKIRQSAIDNDWKRFVRYFKLHNKIKSKL